MEKFRNHKKNVEREAGLAHMIEAANERNDQRDARSKALVERETEARERQGNANFILTASSGGLDRGTSGNLNLGDKRFGRLPQITSKVGVS